MAHTKSALKDIKKSRENREINKQVRGTMKSAVKGFLTRSDLDGAEADYARAMKVVDKAVHKGVLHKNAASHRKSQLDRKLNQLKAGAKK